MIIASGKMTIMEHKYPDVYIFPSLNTSRTNRGDAPPILHYATDDDMLAIAVIGVRTRGNRAAFTLEELKAFYRDAPELIAELEGRNG